MVTIQSATRTHNNHSKKEKKCLQIRLQKQQNNTKGQQQKNITKHKRTYDIKRIILEIRAKKSTP